MKTIKQIEKGCGKTDAIPYKEDYVCCPHKEDDGTILLCSECKRILKQTKEICKRIEDITNEFSGQLNNERLIGMDILKRELLERIKGDLE